MESLRLEKIRPDEVRRMVFSGGGVKGQAHITAIAAAQACGVDLKKVEVCNGTSAGSITSMMVAVGYDVDALFSIMRRLDFRKFMSEEGRTKTAPKVLAAMSKIQAGDTVGVTAKLLPKLGVFKHRVANEGGIYAVDALRGWLEQVVLSQTEIEFCTFKELHELASEPNSKFCDVEMIVFNKNTNAWEKLSWEITPDVVISSGVAASCAFPGFFAECQLQLKDPQINVVDWLSSDLYCDGGVGNNYDVSSWDLEVNGDERFNRSVLGFRLTDSQEVHFLRGIGGLPNQPVENGVVNFIGDMAKALESSQFNNLINSPKDLARTIPIDTKDVTTLELNINEYPERLEALLKSGWESACEYFGQKLEFPEKYKMTPSFIINP